MRGDVRRLALAGLVLVLAQPAGSAARAAEDAPFVTPQQDVDIRYALASPDPSIPLQHQRMRWSAATRRQRVDPEGSATYMITDYRAGSLTVIDQARGARTVIPAPGAALSEPGQRAAGNWARGETMLVAGESCTVWHTHDSDGRVSDVCYSEGGDMLQVMQGDQIVVRAEQVTHDAQPDTVFAVPEGLKVIQAAHP
ncbi:hypothetical protein HLH26_06440 [Gluconacetobacter sp. 1b LMG 1731]|uniref:DUF4412 domain-containing protein n=1 Tax=Gluconacetobacter dulcium TaxID=2729096 RepID=A0A7W4JWQ4_9PROT|nr:hypothetical protein [Gluconacetobacter dulcium]MBB2164182.1 hypothetical protein [Gluconacetobacter dulcium]MBB2193410.1 hypothetical protein [Gluconacetobacter dulcium]MBB2196141.1 hypothetical protein [Gluconacetobacter dulcium]